MYKIKLLIKCLKDVLLLGPFLILIVCAVSYKEMYSEDGVGYTNTISLGGVGYTHIFMMMDYTLSLHMYI